MKQADLTYEDQGLFTGFIPVSKEGEEAFREICRVQGDCTGRVLSTQAKQTIQQLRKAGYSVSKAPKTKPLNNQELDSLFDELMS